jgi:hypothetical protein
MWKRVVTALPLLGTAPALAACPIELAVYRDVDNVASIDFRPTGENAAVTNTFRLLIDGIVLDGIVMWTEAVPRPNGVLGYKCPSGDVTGQELDACTLWQGVIYASDEAGNVALLPAEGSTAPKSLILSDLAHSLRVSAAYDAAGFKRLPGDVFVLSGCQE